MAGAWIKIMMLITCINIFMYMGLGSTGNYLIEGDIMSNYFGFSGDISDQMLEPGSNINMTLDNTLTTLQEKESSVSVPGFSTLSSFIDGLNQVWNFIKLIFNIVFVPITLFSVEGTPFFVKLLFAPLVLVYAASIVQFIRGAS